MTSKRKAGQEVFQFVVLNVENCCQLFYIFGGGLSLAVEDGGDSNFVAAKFFGDSFEGELFVCFGFEQSC